MGARLTIPQIAEALCTIEQEQNSATPAISAALLPLLESLAALLSEELARQLGCWTDLEETNGAFRANLSPASPTDPIPELLHNLDHDADLEWEEEAAALGGPGRAISRVDYLKHTSALMRNTVLLLQSLEQNA